MSRLRVGLVFELLGSLPPAPGRPGDADAEYEPEETILLLEAALRELGHEPVRLGGPRTLLARAAGGAALARAAGGAALGIDAALNIAEGEGSRNREAWAPVLLEMLGVPTLGSDALTLLLVPRQALGEADRGGGGRAHGPSRVPRVRRPRLRPRARRSAFRSS